MIRQPSRRRTLKAMFAVGLLLVIAGAVAWTRVNTAYAGQQLINFQVRLFASEGDIRLDKAYQVACPAAFPPGSPSRIDMSVAQGVRAVTEVADVAVWRRVQTSVSASFVDWSSPNPTGPVSADSIRAATGCLPELRGLPKEVAQQREITTLQLDWSGLAAVTLVPIGIICALPFVLASAVLAMRRIRAGTPQPTAPKLHGSQTSPP